MCVACKVNRYEQVLTLQLLLSESWHLCDSCAGQTIISWLVFISHEKFLLFRPSFNYINIKGGRQFYQTPEAHVTVLIQLLFPLGPIRRCYE